jgi:ribonucleoside-diphosphate reductase alpha chain
LKASQDYFNGDDLAAKVFVDKYSLRDNQDNILEDTPEKSLRRVAKEFARIEKNKFKKPLTEEEIFSLMDRFKYISPQGSPFTGIGNNFQYTTLSNCYLLDVPEDSYSSILKVDQQLVNISKRRGGVGIDISNLRPTGTPTSNAARSSTGTVSWMERYSNSIREVGQHGRRGALMLTISVHHPDILQFVTVKNDDKKVTGANISVRLTKEFLNAVKKDVRI